MRAFFAIDLAPEVKEEIEKLEVELRPRLRRARFVPTENLHWTLRFLGETTPERVDAVARALGREISGRGSFVLDVRGLGLFPDRKRPRVLWVGVATPPDALFDLHESIERVARGAGFAPETRRFEPHVTLARFREPSRGVASIVEPLRERAFGNSVVREVVLYQSHLSPQGSRYLPLERFALQG